MKKSERMIAPAGFFLAGILFVFAAFAPTLRGQPLNAAFLPLGIVFAVLGVVFLRKVQGGGSPPQ